MRPVLPLPSKNGWIVSNCAWISPALMTTGISSSVWINFSRSASAQCISVTGAGTKLAVLGFVPPIQFWLLRNSLGSEKCVARAWFISWPCNSRTKRKDCQALKILNHNLAKHLGNFLKLFNDINITWAFFYLSVSIVDMIVQIFWTSYSVLSDVANNFRCLTLDNKKFFIRNSVNF